MNRNVGIGIIGLVLVATILIILLITGTKINTKVVPKGNIVLTTPYQTYLLGEEITFTIHNNFNSSIVIKNNCPAEPLDVYRYENNTWVRVHDNADEKACASNQRTVSIPANGQRDASFVYWPDLFNKPGKYRIVAYVDYYEQLPFADFEVIEKPPIPTVRDTTSSTSDNGTATDQSSSTDTVNTSVNTLTTSRKTQTITLAQGNIIAEYEGQIIYIKSITPNAGWRYEGGQSGSQVEITFKRTEQEIKVVLQIRNGAITYFTEQDND